MVGTFDDEIERLLYVSGHRRTWRGQKPTARGGSGESEEGLIQKLRAFDGRPLKARDLADLLRVSKETVLRRAKQGIYPSFREGNAVHFNPVALIRYFQNKGVR